MMFASVIAGAGAAAPGAGAGALPCIVDDSAGVIAPAALSLVVGFSFAHAAMAIAPPTRATRVKRLLSMFFLLLQYRGWWVQPGKRGQEAYARWSLRFAGRSDYLVHHHARRHTRK